MNTQYKINVYGVVKRQLNYGERGCTIRFKLNKFWTEVDDDFLRELKEQLNKDFPGHQFVLLKKRKNLLLAIDGGKRARIDQEYPDNFTFGGALTREEAKELVTLILEPHRRVCVKKGGNCL